MYVVKQVPSSMILNRIQEYLEQFTKVFTSKSEKSKPEDDMLSRALLIRSMPGPLTHIHIHTFTYSWNNASNSSYLKEDTITL